MNLPKKDISRMLWPFLFFLLSVSIAAGMAVMGQRLLQQMIRQSNEAEHRLIVAQGEISNVRRERDYFAAYEERYRVLVKKGIIGDFQRLDLMEQIEKSRTAVPLFDMQYAILPQQRILATDGYEVDVNRADFQLSLLHEGQLLDFMDTLSSRTRGYFTVEKCGIDRINRTAEISYAAQLQAQCRMAWITMRQRP